MEGLILNPEFAITQDSASVFCVCLVLICGSASKSVYSPVGVNKGSALGRIKDEV